MLSAIAYYVMAWETAVTTALRESGVRTVAYLPDSVIAPLIELTERDEYFSSYRVAREEEGVALLGGAWLGGECGVLVCQSSGLATCFNALGSHSIANGLPFVGLVTRRGDLGEHNLVQVAGGYNMPRLLDDIGVRNRSLDAGDPIVPTVERAVDTARSTGQPYVLLLERNLTGGKDD